MSKRTTPESPGQPQNLIKPLKILTLDGGGLQAISTLIILDKLLDTIAQQNGVPGHKPRPCDIFDTIAGIGAGGWLAIFLGRFRMDITSCLTEWYKLTECILPKSKTEKLRMRLVHHCYFDTNRLVEQIDKLTKIYGVGDYLFEHESESARTRHVFVAALKSTASKFGTSKSAASKSEASGYNLFRTYDISNQAARPEKFLEGPENPDRFKISSAFGVTGAAKYFTLEWKERMSESGKIGFSDNKFPKPHNITELALDEMWAIYGTDVAISVVVNLGPGLANQIDIKKIARRFSWGSNTVMTPAQIPFQQQRTPKAEGKGSEGDVLPYNFQQNQNKRHSRSAPVRFLEDVSHQTPNTGVSAEGERKRQFARINTFGSVKGREFDEKLKRFEDEIERDIKKKLGNIYKDGALLYYRIAPANAPEGTTQNDSFASGVALSTTVNFLEQTHVEEQIDGAARRFPGISSEA